MSLLPDPSQRARVLALLALDRLSGIVRIEICFDGTNGRLPDTHIGPLYSTSCHDSPALQHQIHGEIDVTAAV